MSVDRQHVREATLGPVSAIESIPHFRLATLAGLIAMWFVSPLMSIIPIAFYGGVVRLSPVERRTCYFLIALSLGLLNYTKVPESDLARYMMWFEQFSTLPLLEFGSIRSLDPVFYFVTALLAKATGGFGPSFSLFWTVVIYFILFVAIEEISSGVRLDGRWLFAIIVFAALIGYSFSLTGHLVRQYAAMSVFLLSFARGVNRRSHVCLLFGAACLMHLSVLAFLPVIWLVRRKRLDVKLLSAAFGFMLVIGIVLGSQNLFSYFSLIPRTSVEALNFLAGQGSVYLAMSGEGIRLRVFVEYIVVSATLAILLLLDKRDRHVGVRIGLLLLYFLCLLLLVRSTDLLLLRYFFFAFGFIVMAMPFIAKRVRAFGVLALMAFVAVSPLRFLRMLSSSEWTFIDNSHHVFFLTAVDFLRHTPP